MKVRSKRNWITVCCAASCLTTFAVRAWAESPDYGNTAATATPFTLNSSIAGTIGYAGDVDYFRVTMPSSGTLRVYTTGTTDTYGDLMNSSGVILASNDDSNGTANFNISASVPAGTYYVKVRHYSATGTGSYTLSNQFIVTTPDDGNTAATATPFTLNSSRTGTIGYAGDVDYFRVTMPSSGTLRVYTTGTTDTYGDLMNSSGVILASNDDSNGTANFNISASVSAGTYYVKVRHYSATGTGSYTLSNQFVTTPEDGNTAATATPFTLNSSRAGVINYAGDVDYFRITPQCTGTLTAYTTGTTDTYGELRSSSDAVLASNDDFNGTVNFRVSSSVVAGSTYYVRVRHFSPTGTGSYTLFNQVVCAPDDGNTPAMATTFALNSSRASAINYAGDVDYFRITMPSSGTLTAYTTGTTDTVGQLIASDGITVITSNDDSNGTTNFRVSASVPAGTYYVKVRHFSPTGTGGYTLVNSNDDHGNTAATATTFALNSSRAGAINYAGDVDYFRITMPYSGTLTVYTAGITDTYGELRNSSDTVIASNDDSNGTTNFRISASVPAGTYYVKVRHFSGTGTGSYTLYSSTLL